MKLVFREITVLMKSPVNLGFLYGCICCFLFCLSTKVENVILTHFDGMKRILINMGMSCAKLCSA